MKVRFYCDIPAHGWDASVVERGQLSLWAYSTPTPETLKGCKRVAFDVDMPDELIRPPDYVVPATVVSEG